MKYYVYVWTFPNDDVAYIGKGCNDRDTGAKNASFEACRAWVQMTCRRVAYFETEKEALTYEAQLIAQYDPAFNRATGLSPAKWVDDGDIQLVGRLAVQTLAARGAASVTPAAVCAAFCDHMPGGLREESIMFVGDRFSAMFREFSRRNPHHTGKVYIVDQLKAEHYKALGVVLEEENLEEGNVFPVNADFLVAELPTVQYVVMNPPFSEKGSGNRKLWRRFLNKARSLATAGVYCLVPIRNDFDLEHDVIIETVEFESTPALGKAIWVAAHAKVMRGETAERLKFDLSIHISHQYANERTAPPQGPFIGISRNKKLSVLSIRYDAERADASIWVLQGKDLALVERLMEEQSFGIMFEKFQAEKAKRLGHAPSINKSELIMLLNQLLGSSESV